MKIKSLETYEQACHRVPKQELSPEHSARKKELDRELAVLRKQLAYLESDLERMEILTPDQLGAIDDKLFFRGLPW